MVGDHNIQQPYWIFRSFGKIYTVYQFSIVIVELISEIMGQKRKRTGGEAEDSKKPRKNPQRSEKSVEEGHPTEDPKTPSKSSRTVTLKCSPTNWKSALPPNHGKYRRFN